ALAPHPVDGAFDEIANHRLDIASDVADFGEFRRLDLDERRTRETRQSARDLGLADAGGADEDDVVGRDLFADLLWCALPAPAIAERYGDRLLRVSLANDVTIQLLDDLLRRELGEALQCLLGARRRHQPGSSTVILSLV